MIKKMPKVRSAVENVKQDTPKEPSGSFTEAFEAVPEMLIILNAPVLIFFGLPGLFGYGVTWLYAFFGGQPLHTQHFWTVFWIVSLSSVVAALWCYFSSLFDNK